MEIRTQWVASFRDVAGNCFHAADVEIVGTLERQAKDKAIEDNAEAAQIADRVTVAPGRLARF